MTTRAFWYWVATLVVLLLMAMVVEVPPAQGDDTLVCQEDEVAWVVDYRTEGAVEDTVGVTRICIAMDTIEDYAFEAGSQSGYEYGYIDGWGAAVDEAERMAYDRGHEDGFIEGWNASWRETMRDGYTKGRSDGFYEGYYEAIDNTLRPVYDDGYGDGYDDGYADATREDQEWHLQQPEIACAVLYIVPEPVHRHFGPY